MKVSGEVSMLGGAAAFVARYAGRPGGSLPALAGVRIEAYENRLLLRAYDHEAAGSAQLPIAADEPGAVLVPGAMLAEILHALPSGPVELHERQGALHLTGGDERTGEIRFTLPTLALDDQPDPPPMPPPAGSVSTPAFAHAVRRAGRLAARDDLVPVLTGTLLRLSADRLTVAASDRYRVGSCELPWARPASPETEHDVVVPARLLADTAGGLLPDGELELGVLGDDTHTALAIRSTANEQVRSAVLRLLDGRFPPLQPRGAASEADNLGAVTMNAAQLRAGLDRVCLVADRQTAVVLTIEPGHVTLQASGAAAAVGRQTMPAVSEGSGTVTAYNASYLTDGLDFVDGRDVRLTFNEGARGASLLTSPDRPGYRYVVMPRRLPDRAVPD